MSAFSGSPRTPSPINVEDFPPESFDSPPPGQSYQSGAAAFLVYGDAKIDVRSLPPTPTVRKPLSGILSGNIVIGEQHEYSSPKLLTSYLIEKGFHELFFMEQVSQDYVDDISTLVNDGAMSERLEALLRKHDKGHGVEGFGYLDMFSKFAGQAGRLKLTPIDRAGFRYQGGDTGIKRIVGMNQDCERMIREIAENPEHPDHATLRAGKCVFFVGDSHAMRHIKTDFLSYYNESGIADRINAVLQEYRFPESSFFSNLSMKTLEQHAPDKDALVYCDTSKVNKVRGMTFATQYVLMGNDKTIDRISRGNIDKIPAISFEEAASSINDHYDEIDKKYAVSEVAAKAEESPRSSLFGTGGLLPDDEKEESLFLKTHVSPIDPHAEERHGVAAASVQPVEPGAADRYGEDLLAGGLPLRSPSPPIDRMRVVTGVVARAVAKFSTLDRQKAEHREPPSTPRVVIGSHGEVNEREDVGILDSAEKPGHVLKRAKLKKGSYSKDLHRS